MTTAGKVRRLVRDLDREERRAAPWEAAAMALWSGTRLYYVLPLSFDEIAAKVSYTAKARGPRVLAETLFARGTPSCGAYVAQAVEGLLLGVEGELRFEPTGHPGDTRARFGRLLLPAREKPLLLKGHAVYRYIRERLKQSQAAGAREIAVNLISLEGWAHE